MTKLPPKTPQSLWQRTEKDQTGEAGDAAQLAEYLPSIHKALGFTPALHTLGMVVYAHHVQHWGGRSKRIRKAKVMLILVLLDVIV